MRQNTTFIFKIETKSLFSAPETTHRFNIKNIIHTLNMQIIMVFPLKSAAISKSPSRATTTRILIRTRIVAMLYSCTATIITRTLVNKSLTETSNQITKLCAMLMRDGLVLIIIIQPSMTGITRTIQGQLIRQSPKSTEGNFESLKILF